MTVVTSLVAQLGFRFNQSQFNQFNRTINETNTTVNETVNNFKNFQKTVNQTFNNSTTVIHQTINNFNQFNQQLNKTQVTANNTSNAINNTTNTVNNLRFALNRLSGGGSGGRGGSRGGSGGGAGGIFGPGGLAGLLGFGSAVAGAYTLSSITNQASDYVLATDKIAQSTRQVTKEFAALRQVATNARIPVDEFNSAFTNLNKLILDSHNGDSELYTLARLWNIDISGKNGEKINAKELFLRAIESIFTSGLSDEIKIARYNLLIPNRGYELFEKVTNGRKTFEEEAQGNKFLSGLTEQNVETFKEFNKNLAIFFDILQGFAIIIGAEVAEKLNNVASVIRFIVESLSKLANFIPSYANLLPSSLSDNTTNNRGAQNLTVVNNVQIDVPQGTDFDQATYINDGVQNSLSSITREIQTYAPQV